MALTPIARFDVVPYQRIENNEIFNFGVVAFSKPGIDYVRFTITGQGYGGTSPIDVSEMTYNPRTEVYEYWTPIDGSDFTTNGTFTVGAVVHGDDTGSRDLGTISLRINATGALAQYEAWVDGTNGNDGTGEVGNVNLPYLTIAAAVAATQTANGGSSNGNIIHIEEGTYSLGAASVSTTNEWLTLQAASGAVKTNVIINTGGTVRTTNKLRFKGLTLQSTGTGQFITTDSYTTNLWVDDCRLIGSGRYVTNSRPVTHNTGLYWCTDTYIYDVDYGILLGFARNVDIDTVGNDAYQRTAVVINCTVDNSDPGTTGWHADAWQMYTLTGDAADLNCIIYNLKATDLHYQGIFCRDGANVGPVKNIAFVNCLIEMREPGRPTGAAVLTACSFYESWEHIVMWHCTFPLGEMAMYPDAVVKSSFIGNVFWQFRNTNSVPGNTDIPWLDDTNVDENECLYNHFMWVYSLNGPCTPTSQDDDGGYPCPHVYAKRPDSGDPVTATYGGNVLSSTWYPLAGTALIDGVPYIKVPYDLDNKSRIGGSADIGALERGGETKTDITLVLRDS